MHARVYYASRPPARPNKGALGLFMGGLLDYLNPYTAGQAAGRVVATAAGQAAKSAGKTAVRAQDTAQTAISDLVESGQQDLWNTLKWPVIGSVVVATGITVTGIWLLRRKR